MSNGTTASQVSPVIQEQEMGQFQAMFQKISDTIVQASALAKEVSELRAATNELRHDIEYVRSRNKELDQHVLEVREQRDRARGEAEELKHKLATAEAEVEVSRQRVEIVTRQAGDLQESLNRTSKERDDYGMKNLELSEALDKAKEEIRNIEDFASNFLATRKPKASDEPEQPAFMTQGHPEPTVDSRVLAPSEPVNNPIPWDKDRLHTDTPADPYPNPIPKTW